MKELFETLGEMFEPTTMKTEFITLRQNTALKELVEHSDKSMDELTDHVIETLLKLGFLCDSIEESGETLENVLSAMSKALQFDYQIKDKIVVIKPKIKGYE